jgi:NADPH-dependent curcumin reductase CurA
MEHAMTLTSRYVTFDGALQKGQIEADFLKIREETVPALEDGQLLLQPICFSIDPVQRSLLDGGRNFLMEAHVLGRPMNGPAIARVVESRHSAYTAGSIVSGWFDWADYIVWPGHRKRMDLTQIDRRFTKPSHALGIYGLTGLTAYFGIVEVGEIKAGQTVLISSAAGSVGSIAGQIAKILGARVVGLTSTEEKLNALTGQVGFDAALDYRASDFKERLAKLLPNGPDVYFDNVGGELSQTVMRLMKRPARVVECGQIGTYDDADGAWTVNILPIHINGLRFEGFTSGLFKPLWPAAIDKLVGWVDSGKLSPLETEYYGLEALPDALAGLFRGANLGKMVVTIPE